MNITVFGKTLEAAGERVRQMDRTDYKDRALVTIAMALEAGLKKPESKAGYDALYMLKDLIKGGK